MQAKRNKKLVPVARSLRKNMTPQERRLWYGFLKEYPIRFLRQKILGRYVADFYSAEASIIVELDGSQHYEQAGQQSDAERTAFLEQYGLQVLRFSNHEVNTNFSGVCEAIDQAVKTRVQKA